MNRRFDALIEKIRVEARKIERQVNIMEVCGTHTVTAAKYGLRNVLPSNVRLISGPGCPVCVTPQQDIDNIIALANAGVAVATYGDMIKVPGTRMSLDEARTNGANVHVVYSVMDALKLKDAVFFGIGFETTAPMTAVAIKKGLLVYSCHKTMPEAMKAVADSSQIDCFINPGHVSAIIGLKPYEIIQKPQAITGFEPEDMLESILMLLKMIRNNKNIVFNQYKRVVNPSGNKKAQAVLAECFEKCDAEWRGLGTIPRSGLEIKKRYSSQNAKLIYKEIFKRVPKAKEQKGCKCGEVIKGKIFPVECPLFKSRCKPQTPMGACMVSSEGSCSIYYKYFSE
ncbi:MAG: hydrogenase formation protein HypD [Candidatus Woesearchaeota archaeon]